MTITTQIDKKTPLTPPFMPEVEGLTFRKFRGELDYPVMLDIINACKIADEIESSTTLEDIRANYSTLVRCDKDKDLIFAEIDGEAIGYGRCLWSQDAKTKEYRYEHFIFLKPEWRDTDIGQTLSQYLQQRGKETASAHPNDGIKWLESSCNQKQTWWSSLLEKEGFEAFRYGFTMAQDINEPIPDIPCPDGFEIRPFQSDHLHAIWLADHKAFRDHFGYVEPTEEQIDFANWQKFSTYMPNLWKVAWFGDEVAALVLNFVDENYNKKYDKKRGYTEGISTRRQFRKKGLATYLITESMKMFQEMGMTEVALGVDALNPTGALNLYEGLGYIVTERGDNYHKRLNENELSAYSRSK